MDQIDTTTAMGRLFFRVMSAVSELERASSSSAPGRGLKQHAPVGEWAAAKPLDKKTVKKMLVLYDSKELTVPEVCEECGVSKATLYKYVRERDADEGGA